MDKRLEEQLERVRKLSERVAQIHEQLERNTHLMRGQVSRAEAGRGEVREFRSAPPDPDRAGSSLATRAVAAERPRRLRRQ
ncbi:MAG: hypothetical protein AB7H96_19475 [Vicinamibacterales bacterium]